MGVVGEACLFQPGRLVGNLLTDLPYAAGIWNVLPAPSVLLWCIGCPRAEGGVGLFVLFLNGGNMGKQSSVSGAVAGPGPRIPVP